MDVVLSYDYGGATYTDTFALLAIKCMDEPDSLRRNAVIHQYLNGGLEEQINGFFKDPITMLFKPVTTIQERRFLVSWYLASAKRIIYGNYVSEGVTDETLVSEWLYDCEHNRSFEIKLWDEHKYYAWEDGIIAEADLYIKLAVEMSADATQDVPETFTTNLVSGKLETMQNGDPWPSFNAATHDHYISILASDGSGAIYPASFTIAAGNIVITTFPAGNYILAPDGKLYANFSIAAVAK